MSNDIDWLIEAHYHDVISNAEVEFDAAYLLNLFPAAMCYMVESRLKDRDTIYVLESPIEKIRSWRDS